jgi:carbamoylphosphate synthase large subunit/anthranilate/para-aminobenzoate synthase component II
MEGLALADVVTCVEPYWWTATGPSPSEPTAERTRPLVAVYDFGVKYNILRRLRAQGFRVRVFPARTPASEILALEAAGVLLSNGPGDPEPLDFAIEAAREVAHQLPTFGICLGHQLLGLAFGARTRKLKFGHRGTNHPVIDRRTGVVEVTSQNHGFMVDGDTLPAGEFELTHWSGNDGTLEGMVHRKLPGARLPVPPRGEPGPARFAPVVQGVRRRDRTQRSRRRRAPCRGAGRERRADPRGGDRRTNPRRCDRRRRRAPGKGRALMPRRTDIRRILVLGAGPIVIGQACEFDYSGTQGCRALKALGYEVVLLNSNPATIMTDPEFADRTYVEPLIPEIAERIIAKERPDALLPTLGGQTALNLAVALAHRGTLEKYDVQLIGASLAAIETAEDRDRFKTAMQQAGMLLPKSGYATTVADAVALGEQLGYPLVIRSSFTLGGQGSGLVHDRRHLREAARIGIAASPNSSILIEECLLGWKEFELEVMRDRHDNVVIVCSIENFDPMGVHTGDSITVAPAQTLSDKCYQDMRDAALRIIRAIRIEAGGCNIQFAVHPRTGEMRVIEMNPRVSRSSALASKATGFPIAEDLDDARRGADAGRDPERHHEEDAGVLRAVARLLRGQDPALGVREVPRHRPPPGHAHEVGGRGDGDRPHVPRSAAERLARAWRPAATRCPSPRSRRSWSRCRSRCASRRRTGSATSSGCWPRASSPRRSPS